MPKCGKCGKPDATVEEIRACYQGSVSAVGVAPDGKIVTVLDIERAPFQPVTEDGFYTGPDGVAIYKVVTSQQSGRLYAKMLRVNGDNTGTWEYAPGVVRALNALDKLTEERAREFGKLYGVCCICGRTLTNEESIAAGIGPICSGKQGW